MTLQPTYPFPSAPTSATTIAQPGRPDRAEDTRQAPTNSADARSIAPREGLASAHSAAPRPTLATIARYPALCGCPDLTNHNQVIEAIGYHDLALRLSKRARWTRVERAAIAAETAQILIEARASHQAALAIWSEIAKARGMQMLSDAQDAAIAAEGQVAA